MTAATAEAAARPRLSTITSTPSHYYDNFVLNYYSHLVRGFVVVLRFAFLTGRSFHATNDEASSNNAIHDEDFDNLPTEQFSSSSTSSSFKNYNQQHLSL